MPASGAGLRVERGWTGLLQLMMVSAALRAGGPLCAGGTRGGRDGQGNLSPAKLLPLPNPPAVWDFICAENAQCLGFTSRKRQP